MPVAVAAAKSSAASGADACSIGPPDTWVAAGGGGGALVGMGPSFLTVLGTVVDLLALDDTALPCMGKAAPTFVEVVFLIWKSFMSAGEPSTCSPSILTNTLNAPDLSEIHRSKYEPSP